MTDGQNLNLRCVRFCRKIFANKICRAQNDSGSSPTEFLNREPQPDALIIWRTTYEIKALAVLR